MFLKKGEDGQYMVEFALTVSIFVFFMLFVIDIGLMIYNQNLFYNAVYRAAREASLGASNDEIKRSFERIAVEKYYPTMTMKAHLEGGLSIEPPEEINRVQGETVAISTNSILGINFLGLVNITTRHEISSQELITIRNDRDRDGCKDDLEGDGSLTSNPECGYDDFTQTMRRDHDNNGIQDDYQFNGPDNDADGDGALDGGDTVIIAYFDNVTASCPSAALSAGGSIGGVTISAGASVSCYAGSYYRGYAIYRPNNALTGSCSVFTWSAPLYHTSTLPYQPDPCFTGEYHAPEIWDDGKTAPIKLFKRVLPKWHIDNSTHIAQIRTINAIYDHDNDAWTDKYDDHPSDPTEH